MLSNLSISKIKVEIKLFLQDCVQLETFRTNQGTSHRVGKLLLMFFEDGFGPITPGITALALKTRNGLIAMTRFRVRSNRVFEF